MFRIAAVVAVLMGAALWAVGGEVEEARACTGFGPDHTFTYAPVVFEGWVRELTPIPDGSVSGANHLVRFEVVRGHRGTTGGELLEAAVYLRLPGGVPEPCPSIAPDEVAGKYVIASLTGEAELRIFGGTIYIADGPGLSPPDWYSYTDALRITELATDSNPDRPHLQVTPSEVRCGEAVTFHGERFAEGAYVLAISYRGIGLAQVFVGPSDSGRFEVTVVVPPCPPPHPESAPWVVSASPIVPSTDILSLGEPEEWAVLTVTGTLAEPRGEPQLEVVSGAVCGGLASLRGTGFAPNRSYPVYGGSPEDKSATADAEGRLHFELEIPPESCEHGSVLSVWVIQPGFGAFGSRFAIASVLFETREAPPGPPDLGNTPPHAAPSIPWLHLAGIVALVLGVSALVARR